jgi:hypothetical protein
MSAFYLIISGRNPSGDNAYFVMKLQPKTLELRQESMLAKTPA